MINQTGGSVEERIAEERERSNAQIRTMLDEQRRTIIAEYGEKVLHHELLAAQAEQNRRILQEELLRQQQDFREVHQQDLMKQRELQKFQNSTFDEFTKQNFDSAIHRTNCAEARGDCTGADVGESCWHARCCTTTGPGQPAEISQLPTVDKVAYIPVVVQWQVPTDQIV